MNVRVSNLPGAVRTFSTMSRRISALTVVMDSAWWSPSVTVTL